MTNDFERNKKIYDLMREIAMSQNVVIETHRQRPPKVTTLPPKRITIMKSRDAGKSEIIYDFSKFRLTETEN